MNDLQTHLFQCSSEYPHEDQDIRSFQPQSTEEKSEHNLSSYLNQQNNQSNILEQQSAINPQTYNTQSEEIKSDSFMNLSQRHYMVYPEIYESYRNQQCVQETNGTSFRMLVYSKGRQQLFYRECVHIDLPGIVSLTHYQNGDYKITNGQKVYFWHEEDKVLDKYSVTI